MSKTNRIADGWKETEIGKIPWDWDLKKIDDIKALQKHSIAMGPFGSDITTDNFIEDGVPVIRGNNLSDYIFHDDDFVFISEEKADQLKASNCINGDIIITHRGNLGQVGIIPKNCRYKRYVVSQSGMKLTCNPNIVDNGFVFYFLKSRYGQYLLLRNSSQVGVPAIAQPTSSLKEIVLPVPPLPEQKAIAAVLSSFDDKIEILREQNRTSEQIAQAIFKEWFVNFNFPCLLVYDERTQAQHPELMQYGYKSFGGLPAPQPEKYFIYVLELENGHHYIGQTEFLLRRFHEHKSGDGADYTGHHKPLKIIHWEEFSSRKEAVDREQWLKTGFGRKWIKREKDAQRLRQAGGKMIESELGEIPDGWDIAFIEDCFDFLEGPGIRNWQYTDSGTRFINIRLIQDGDIDAKNSNFISVDEANGKYAHFHLKEKDFVISTSGTLGRGAIVRKEHLPLLLNTSVIRFKPKGQKNYGFMYQFLQSQYFLHELKSLASGSVQLNFGPIHLKQIKLTMPDENLLGNFSNIVDSVYEKLILNLSQIQSLIHIRDTLLPKLMSGDIRVQI